MTTGISRRGTFAIGVGLPVAIAGSAEAADGRPAGPTPSFTLVLVNDIYRLGETKGRGGFARLAAIVAAERSRGVPTLFCHAGDTFSPSLLSGFDKGAHIVALTNLIGPDVFVPGNHEFDFGQAEFMARLRESRFPYLAANMTQADGSPVPGVQPSRIHELGPVKVGLVGLVMEDVHRVSHPGDLRFEPVLPTLRREAAALRAAGADLVVAVAHTDRAVDLEIVRSRLVDVLLTGHDHDLAISFDGKTVMVESSEEGNYVTAIDISATIGTEDGRRRVTWAPAFRVHDSTTVAPDPDVLKVVRVYEDGLSAVLDVPIGRTLAPLDSRTAVVRSGEAAIGNLVADAIRAAHAADIALLNAGAIRSNELYGAGTTLRRRDIYGELPFGNTTVLVELPGRAVLALLENGFSRAGTPSGRFPQISGLRVAWDPQAPAGARVREAAAGGAPLEPERLYRVAATDFMFGGGDGYGALAAGRVLVGGTDGKLVASEVIAYVAERREIDPKVEGRIVALPSP